MPTPPTENDVLLATHAAYLANDENQTATAKALGCSRETVQRHLRQGAERGLIGTEPVMPGYYISQETAVYDGEGNLRAEFIQQKPERGEQFEMPAGQKIKGVSALVDPHGREIIKWIKTDTDREQAEAIMRAAVDALKEEIPRADPVAVPRWANGDLLCQYTITDAHLGALAWNEETGGGDYDLSIGERLIVDWFAAAIATSPPARRAVFAQLGDFLHYDSFKSITPEHGHLLDGDTRYPKMVRAAIRIVRTVIRLLLEKHEEIDIIMSDANHDPSSEVWLREMLAAFYDHEPRIKVDTNPGTYSMIEHGDVTLFYHHGHRRGVANVDSVFVGKFRQAYGRTRFSYAHVGHKHADELKTTNLMKVEQHETLAAPDAYAANGGWLSGRSAKVIYYHSRFGYVGRNVMTPEMVAGAYVAANDNEPKQDAA
ncbi:MAG: oxidoreductase [Mesorhizobium sp.]|nr:MAG: oxidoreductase [Mesorhizobium sp.]RWN73209.1 MAG: oxidoreductase [Mesorhizobium sp.]RWN85138.1 MAG: oxidoreductase [Mesorhizobium sp.]RWO58144.1 MAG: oxidoreductase [Mesorhizobium sp.]